MLELILALVLMALTTYIVYRILTGHIGRYELYAYLVVLIVSMVASLLSITYFSVTVTGYAVYTGNLTITTMINNTVTTTIENATFTKPLYGSNPYTTILYVPIVYIILVMIIVVGLLLARSVQWIVE